MHKVQGTHKRNSSYSSCSTPHPGRLATSELPTIAHFQDSQHTVFDLKVDEKRAACSQFLQANVEVILVSINSAGRCLVSVYASYHFSSNTALLLYVPQLLEVEGHMQTNAYTFKLKTYRIIAKSNQTLEPPPSPNTHTQLSFICVLVTPTSYRCVVQGSFVYSVPSPVMNMQFIIATLRNFNNRSEHTSSA